MMDRASGMSFGARLIREKKDRGWKWVKGRRGKKPVVRPHRFETLEERTVFAVAGFDTTSWLGAPYNYSTNGMGLPILHSNPGATAAIFLDFDGGGGGEYSGVVYDTDGNTSNFSAAEQSDIFYAWRTVANAYAAFNIDVTTEWNASQPKAWITVNSTGSFRQASSNSFGNPSNPGGSVPKADTTSRPQSFIHEIGHMFGADHQEWYDENGNKLDEYAPKIDDNHGVIMGRDWEGSTPKFVDALSGAGVFQDDLAVIAAKISSVVGGTGYRTDDYVHGGSSVQWMDSTSYPGYFVTAGINEHSNDADRFKFTSTGGKYSIYASTDFGSAADVKLRVYDSSSTLLYESSDARNQSQLTLDLPAGTIFVQVQGENNYGDIGTYNLIVARPTTSANAFWANSDIGNPGQRGASFYEPTSGTYTIAGSGADIAGSSDHFQYNYMKLSGDGSIEGLVTDVDPTHGSAKMGLMIRETLDANSKNVNILSMPTTGIRMQYRSSIGASSGTQAILGSTFTPMYVKLERLGNTFNTYTKVNSGDSWILLGTRSVTMGSTVYMGIASTSHDNKDISYGQITNVAVTGNVSNANPSAPVINGLASPSSVTFTNVATTTATVNWTNVSGETGFTIERSNGKGGFEVAGTVAANVLTFNDSGLLPGRKYFYRIRSNDATGVSAGSSGLDSMDTRPGPVTDLRLISSGADRMTVQWYGYGLMRETGFRVERSTDGVNFSTVATRSANDTGFIDTGLTTDTLYYYRVVTTDAAGDAATSAVVSRRTRLESVNNLAFTSTHETVTLSWTENLINEDGFLVQREEDEGWQTVATLPPNSTTAVILDQNAHSRHDYRVFAHNDGVEGNKTTIYTLTKPNPVNPLPTPLTSINLGNQSRPGQWDFRYDSAESEQEFRTWAATGTIGGTSDNMTFAYATRSVANITLTARVEYMNYGVSGSEAGIMIRQDSSAGSKYVFLALEELSGGSNRAEFSRRNSANGTAAQVGSSVNNLSNDYWLRMTLSGAGSTKTVTAAISPDGVTWTNMSSTTTISLSGNMLVGLAYNSNTTDDAKPWSARFTNLTITGGANVAPYAKDDTSSTTENVPLVGNVLTNDYDINGNALTATQLTSPTNGSVTFSSNGAYTYTPNASFTGTDSFTYRATDGNANSNTGTVTITVNPSAGLMFAFEGMEAESNLRSPALTEGRSRDEAFGSMGEHFDPAHEGCCCGACLLAEAIFKENNGQKKRGEVKVPENGEQAIFHASLAQQRWESFPGISRQIRSRV
ncbi:Ig-like domain-containing protein [Aeoliella sp. SH292]|uniref:Ig-like domain-containing protein n=1 Tax=Aeoliella sp. SH292 TaxID=3454464 RepID=UPI003F9B2278